MARLRSHASLILVITLWYTLTGVLGVSLHQHLGWHPLVSPADSGTCRGRSFCTAGLPAGCTLECGTSSVSPLGRFDLAASWEASPNLRATGGTSWSHCPICQFQFQPKTAQLVLRFTSSTPFFRLTSLEPVAQVVFTPDFSWQSRAPPSV